MSACSQIFHDNHSRAFLDIMSIVISVRHRVKTEPKCVRVALKVITAHEEVLGLVGYNSLPCNQDGR